MMAKVIVNTLVLSSVPDNTKSRASIGLESSLYICYLYPSLS